MRITKNKNNILSVDYVKNLWKKNVIKRCKGNSCKYKVNFNYVKKFNDLETFENSSFLFRNSNFSVMFINKELPHVLADNDIDTDKSFNAIWESIRT